MADDPTTPHDATPGGVAGLHPEVPLPPAIVAATQTGQEHNTLRRAIIPFACWRAHDLRFQFDSSFVLPAIREEIQILKSLMDRHTLPDQSGKPTFLPSLSVFGHADPTGSDGYNKVLSGRRAQAIYALLVRDVDLWEDLYQHPQGRDQWEPDAIQTMQSELGQDSTTNPSASDRKALYKDYMDSVCTVPDADGNSVVFQLAKTDFLARGADAKGKGDYQGCSEFNPVLIFSDEQTQQFADPAQKDARDSANAINRRVVIFLFRPGVQIDPNSWPCPRATEGVEGCRKRFWSDGEQRRSTRLPDQERKYKDTHDTVACRFYDRLSIKSPCEQMGSFYLRVCLRDDAGVPRPGLAYTLTINGNAVDGQTDGKGMLEEEVPASATGGTLTVDGQDVQFSLVQQMPTATKADGAQKRLKNLAYYFGDTDGEMNDATRDAIRNFQSDLGEDDPTINATGELDAKTSQAMVDTHGC